MGVLASVFQVGNGVYAKWRNGMGVGPQVMFAGVGVGDVVVEGEGAVVILRKGGNRLLER